MEDRASWLQLIGFRAKHLGLRFLAALVLVTTMPCRAQSVEIVALQGRVMQVVQMDLNLQRGEIIQLCEQTLNEFASKEPLGQPEILQIRMSYAMALRLSGRLREAEAQDRIIIHFTAPYGASQLLRDADSQVFIMATADGRLVEASNAAHAALSVERALLLIDNKDQLANDAPLLPFFLLQAADSDMLVGNSLSALALYLECRTLLAPRTDAMSVSQKRFVLSSLVRIYAGVGDDRPVPGLLDELDAISTASEDRESYNQLLLESELDSALRTGDFKTARAKAQETYDHALKAYTNRDPYIMAKALIGLADNYFVAGDNARSRENFLKAFAEYRRVFEVRFLSMTEAEKHQFAIEVQGGLSDFYSFCLANQAAFPDLSSDAYGVALWQKTMVADSMRAQKERLSAAASPDLSASATRLQNMRVDLATRMRSNSRDPQLAGLQANIDDADRELTSRLAAHAYGTGVTLDALRKALPAQDSAVEIVQFPLRDRLGPTNRKIYAALILLPGVEHSAIMMRLGDSQAIEANQKELSAAIGVRGIPGINGSQETKANAPMYSSLPWLGLEQTLRPARRIYLSPDGVLDTTPFFAWRHSDGRYLLEHEEIDLRPVFSTAEIAIPRTASSSRDAVLIGNPDFNLSILPGTATLDTASSASALRDATGVTVKDLPYTGVELQAVRTTLSTTKLYALRGDYERERATKTALLQVSHPAILHVATHGFFFSSESTGGDTDPLGLEISLLRSGLLFAGANRTLAHDDDTEQADNGVMTALEVAGLDLRGTQLATLSACETGLGERGTSGEVLGLRRSLHVAGAQRVLVSMWQVDDMATATLMKGFYERWLTGEDPYDALRHAALEVRKDHPTSPYLWAPFVLYGP